MKRFLVILTAVFLMAALLILPAAADNVYEGRVEGVNAYFDGVSPGYYELRVYTNESRSEVLLSIPYFELRDGSYSESYTGLSSIFDNVTMDVNYSDQLFQCAMFGISQHDGTTFYVFGSTRYPDVVAELIPVERHMTFLESIGSFFSSSMQMLSDVMTVVISSPALLIMTIGVVILAYIAYQIKRLM